MNARHRNTLLMALLILAALFISVPAYSQDLTPEPGAPAATQEATPAPDTPPVIPANNTGSIMLVIAGILAIVAGGGGILTMIERFRQNKQALSAAEQLGDSVPRPIAEKLIEVIKILSATGNVLVEAVDGIPVDSKPVAQERSLNSFSTSELAAELALRQSLKSAPGVPRINPNSPTNFED